MTGCFCKKICVTLKKSSYFLKFEFYLECRSQFAPVFLVVHLLVLVPLLLLLLLLLFLLVQPLLRQNPLDDLCLRSGHRGGGGRGGGTLGVSLSLNLSAWSSGGGGGGVGRFGGNPRGLKLV